MAVLCSDVKSQGVFQKNGIHGTYSKKFSARTFKASQIAWGESTNWRLDYKKFKGVS